MIVELLGPPGVGKTTVSHSLVELLLDHEMAAQSVNLTGYFDLHGRPLSAAEIRWDRLRGLASSPRLLAATVRCYIQEGGGEALSWMVNLCRRNRAARGIRGGPGVVVLEEGPLSALCLAVSARTRLWRVDPVVPVIHLPDAVVVLSADTDVVVDRVVQRGGILGDRLIVEVAALVEGYREAATQLEDRLAVPVLRYSTGATDPRVVAQRIAADLELVPRP